MTIAQQFTADCYTQVGARLFVPQGRLTVAQQFTAGEMGKIKGVSSPVGTVEDVIRVPLSIVFQSSLRDEQVFSAFLPSDKSLGYCRTTLRVETFAASVAFGPKNMGNDKPFPLPSPPSSLPYFFAIAAVRIAAVLSRMIRGSTGRPSNRHLRTSLPEMNTGFSSLWLSIRSTRPADS